MNAFMKKMKKKIKPGWWKNPDFYIALSFLSYFLFALELIIGPHLITFFQGGLEIAQVLAFFFLIAGALFSGVGNWISFGYEVYPGYMEEPSEEVIEELQALLVERRRELQEEKMKNAENNTGDK